jgi:hypothetical protein
MFRRRCIRSAYLSLERNHQPSFSLGAISKPLQPHAVASFSVWAEHEDAAGNHQHSAHSSEGHQHSPHYPSDHGQHTPPRAARKPTSAEQPSSPFTDTAVADYSERKPTRLTLKTLLHFGKQIDETKVGATIDCVMPLTD